MRFRRRGAARSAPSKIATNYAEAIMDATSVTSKGQVTISKEVRHQRGNDNS